MVYTVAQSWYPITAPVPGVRAYADKMDSKFRLLGLLVAAKRTDREGLDHPRPLEEQMWFVAPYWFAHHVRHEWPTHVLPIKGIPQC